MVPSRAPPTPSSCFLARQIKIEDYPGRLQVRSKRMVQGIHTSIASPREVHSCASKHLVNHLDVVYRQDISPACNQLAPVCGPISPRTGNYQHRTAPYLSRPFLSPNLDAQDACQFVSTAANDQHASSPLCSETEIVSTSYRSLANNSVCPSIYDQLCISLSASRRSSQAASWKPVSVRYSHQSTSPSARSTACPAPAVDSASRTARGLRSPYPPGRR